MQNIEQRLEKLENDQLHQQAISICQAKATAILLTILKDSLPRAGVAVSADQVQKVYHATLRREVESFLKRVADDQPDLATALRKILASELDAP